MLKYDYSKKLGAGYPEAAGTIRGMARVLLGVPGGSPPTRRARSAACSSKAGHEVVPARHAGRRALRHRRDVSRARAAASARRRLPPPDARRPAPRRAVHGEHARQARARARRQRPHRGGARPPRAGARRAGDESADVVASRRPARTPRRCARAASCSSGPTRARRRRASSAWGGWPSRTRSSRAAEALLAGTGRSAGKRVLISAGGTREPIDAVRFVGNRSSGRMGVALAAEARRRGARRDAARREPRRAGAGRVSSSSRRRPQPSSSARRSRAARRPTS